MNRPALLKKLTAAFRRAGYIPGPTDTDFHERDAKGFQVSKESIANYVGEILVFQDLSIVVRADTHEDANKLKQVISSIS